VLLLFTSVLLRDRSAPIVVSTIHGNGEAGEGARKRRSGTSAGQNEASLECAATLHPSSFQNSAAHVVHLFIMHAAGILTP
jgi:hypothetical protein